MAAISPSEQMQSVLSDFSPDWAVVVELVNASKGDPAVSAVRAGPDEDTPLHSAAYWGELEAIGTMHDLFL